MLYEPEAIGAYAYAPVGIRKERREQVKGEALARQRPD
jgi:hypothetical protein